MTKFNYEKEYWKLRKQYSNLLEHHKDLTNGVLSLTNDIRSTEPCADDATITLVDRHVTKLLDRHSGNIPSK